MREQGGSDTKTTMSVLLIQDTTVRQGTHHLNFDKTQVLCHVKQITINFCYHNPVVHMYNHYFNLYRINTTLFSCSFYYPTTCFDRL
jgi:hypothetical protein